MYDGTCLKRHIYANLFKLSREGRGGLSLWVGLGRARGYFCLKWC